MESEEKDLTIVQLKLPPSTKISFITAANGEIGHLKVINSKLTLLRGRLYKLPVNTLLGLDNYYMLRMKGSLREVIDIRNISDGIASIIPLIHNTVVYDGMILGQFV